MFSPQVMGDQIERVMSRPQMALRRGGTLHEMRDAHHDTLQHDTIEAHLENVGAAAQRSEGGGHGPGQHCQGVVRRQHAGHLPRQPEGHQLRDRQHLRARAEGIPARNIAALTLQLPPNMHVAQSTPTLSAVSWQAVIKHIVGTAAACHSRGLKASQSV